MLCHQIINKLSEFSFEAGSQLFCLVVPHSMAGTLIPIFEVEEGGLL